MTGPDDTPPTGPQLVGTEAIGALAELLTMARHCKAMFDSLIEAGFTEQQALHLTAATLGGQR